MSDTENIQWLLMIIESQQKKIGLLRTDLDRADDLIEELQAEIFQLELAL